MKKINDSKNKYSIVVAHPDDEILWASSILEKAEKVIICFGKTNYSKIISEGRIGFSLNAPRNFYFLNITEPSGFPFNYFPDKSQTSNNNTYLNNFYGDLKITLFKLIDTDIVYTHNPWENMDIFITLKFIKL